VIVVEVISPTSAHSDTSAKLIGYFKLPSVQHYLVIDPDARTVTHHSEPMERLLPQHAHPAPSGSIRRALPSGSPTCLADR
jgi:Uma2 family endonuclease